MEARRTLWICLLFIILLKTENAFPYWHEDSQAREKLKKKEKNKGKENTTCEAKVRLLIDLQP